MMLSARLALSLVALVSAGTGAAGGPASVSWSPEAARIVERVAVQEDGRVKPLKTLATFKILRYRGLRQAKTAHEDGEYRTPVEFLLDCVLQPEVAKSYPIFLVNNSEVLDDIGLHQIARKKRDRYSFLELEPGLPRLFERAREHAQIEEANRSIVGQQTLHLRSNVYDFAQLTSYLEFARATFRVDGSEKLRELFGGKETVRCSEVLAHAPAIVAEFHRQVRDTREDARMSAHGGGHGDSLADTPEKVLLHRLGTAADLATSLAIIAPPDPKAEAWWSFGDLIARMIDGASTVPASHVALVAGAERLVDALGTTRFDAELASFASALDALAAPRGVGDKVALEVTYYSAGFLDKAFYGFTICFLLLLGVWFAPRARLLPKLVGFATLIPLGLLVTAIVFRCLIRERPPISTLYETILFVTAIVVGVMLLVEVFNRQRIALSAAVVLGTGGMLFANRWEMHEARDTMPQLVAVLDTNFWLATHVTAVVIGYAASLLAAALANLWLLARFASAGLFGLSSRRWSSFFTTVARFTYGCVCFGLLFSTVGTILGGIWANDSWGRFWGWDPKENGALMICLMQLAILHARLGGFIRHFGLAWLSVILGMVTAFSWWHVNQLGVGLHSYGPASGVLRNLWIFYGIETAVLTGAALLALLQWAHAKGRAHAAA